LPADTDLASVHRKLAYDLYYVQHVSALLDLKILLSTPFYAFGMSCRKLGSLFFLPTSEVIDRHTQAALFTPSVIRQRLSA